jgi:hypothetical protein
LTRIEDADDRAFASTIGAAASHIGANLHRECVALYRGGEGDLRQRLDAATVRLGGNVLVDGVLRLMTSAQAARGGMWSKILDIIEAIKKIYKIFSAFRFSA